jgi:membrane protein YdbS with pleckstrin-like domain
MEPAERLLHENRRKFAALPWWRRFPWLLLLAVPFAVLFWALQLLTGWRLIAPLVFGLN